VEEYEFVPVKGPYNGEEMELEIIAHIIRTILYKYHFKLVINNNHEIHLISTVTPEVTMKFV